MSRSKKLKNAANADATGTLKSAKKSLDQAIRTGAKNIAPAAAIAGAVHHFADPVLAVGFFTEIAHKAFSDADKKRWRKQGEAILASIVTVPVAQNAKGDEIIVSLPIAEAGDAPERLVALGLKQTLRPAASRPYIEYRGRVDIAAVEAVAGPVGGVVTLVQRPAAEGETDQPLSNGKTPERKIAAPSDDANDISALEVELEAALKEVASYPLDPPPKATAPASSEQPSQPLENAGAPGPAKASSETRTETPPVAGAAEAQPAVQNPGSRQGGEERAAGVQPHRPPMTPLPGLGGQLISAKPSMPPRMPARSEFRKPG
jgi:hypothetical protein